MHVEYSTLRIWEPEIQNLGNETEEVSKKYKNLTMSSSLKNKKEKKRKRKQ